MTARPTVLAGPSGVGKDTVAYAMRQRHPSVWMSVSVTTRPRRPNEVDGVDYRFVDENEFDEMVANDEFLEWATVHNKYRYGTPRGPIDEALKQGLSPLLVIDLAGARAVRQAMPDARFVFLLPPTWDELVRRLVGRGTEDAEERERRLATAKVELAAESEFDVTIVNDDVDKAADELAQIMGVSGPPEGS